MPSPEKPDPLAALLADLASPGWGLVLLIVALAVVVLVLLAVDLLRW